MRRNGTILPGPQISWAGNGKEAFYDAIWYIRVSSQEQLDGSGLKRQRESIEHYARTHLAQDGTRIRLVAQKSVSDEGLSAYTAENLKADAGLGGILEEVRKSIFPYKIILTEHPDRLSRQGIHATIGIIRELNLAGIEVHFTLINLVCHKGNLEDVGTHIQAAIAGATSFDEMKKGPTVCMVVGRNP